MPKISFGNNSFKVLEDLSCPNYNFLKNYTDWNKDWVQYCNQIEKITITNEHYKVINVLRTYYKKNGIHPTIRILSILTGLTAPTIYRLFPSGPSRGACRMAGLPQPSG